MNISLTNTREVSVAEHAFDAARTAPKFYKNSYGFTPSILRSALFSTASGKRAVFSEFTPVPVMISTAKVEFRGEELRQDDLRMLLALIKQKAGMVISQTITLDARKFGIELGWSNSGITADKVKDCVRRLKNAAVRIYLGANVELCFSFITDYEIEGQQVRVWLSDRIAEVLNNGITYLPVETRSELKDGLESWLFDDIKADAWFAPVDVHKLKEASGSSFKEQKEFNRALKSTLEVFAKRKIINSFELKSGKLTIKKA